MRLNQQKIIEDIIPILPKLRNGIDVNVKFQTITNFEYSTELSIFDLVGLPVVHGWLIDPEDVSTASVIKDRSYNTIINIAAKYNDLVGEPIDATRDTASLGSREVANTNKEEVDALVTEGAIITSFLSSTASQLTYHGLCELHECLKDNSISVLYRNNHFSTLFKYNGELYTLVTDLGIGREHDRYIWEKLNQVFINYQTNLLLSL